MESRAAVFASARPFLFSIAYRMLGSVMDAEDVVQDAFLRWQEAPETDIRSPRAYLTTIVTRLAINHLRAGDARAVRRPRADGGPAPGQRARLDDLSSAGAD